MTIARAFLKFNINHLSHRGSFLDIYTHLRLLVKTQSVVRSTYVKPFVYLNNLEGDILQTAFA